MKFTKLQFGNEIFEYKSLSLLLEKLDLFKYPVWNYLCRMNRLKKYDLTRFESKEGTIYDGIVEDIEIYKGDNFIDCEAYKVRELESNKILVVEIDELYSFIPMNIIVNKKKLMKELIDKIWTDFVVQNKTNLKIKW